MIFFYFFFAAESKSEICLFQARLDFAAHKAIIFRKQ